MGIEMERIAYEEKKRDTSVSEMDDEDAAAALKLGKTLFVAHNKKKPEDIPAELVCPVCKDLLADAIMMPSCLCSMCDECARDSLIDADNTTNICPVCGKPGNPPDDLIPWRKMRDQVDKYRNSSGYNL